MRLWIYLVFAVLCSCNAQNEDSLGRLPDGWDDYDDDWYNGDFDEAVASKEILNENNDEETPDASVQDIVEDLPLEETDKFVDEEIQKFLQETKDENPFKDYQIEDNRSNNQDEKSLQNNSEDTMSYEANNDDSIKIEDINDGKQPQDEDLEMSLLKPNYDTDQEVIEDDQSAIEPSREINDALSDLDDEDVLQAVEELKQISAQLDATVNDVVNATNEEQRNLEQQKQELTDEEIPSAPEEPIQGYEDIIIDAKRILNETEDALDVNKESKSDLNSQQEPEEKQDSIIEKDIGIKVSEIGSDQVLQIKEDESLEVNKNISSEINISEDELENVLKENQELDDDLKQLFAIRDDEPENSKEIEDFDIAEVDFDKLFDEMKSQEKIAAETVKTSHENIVEAKENNTSVKEDKEPIQIVEDKDSSVQSKPLEENVENQEVSDVIKEKDESTVEKTTKINKVESKKVEELTSSEFQDLLDQFTANHQDDLDITSKSFNKDVAPVYIELSAVNIETVTSPGYPSPYPTNNIIDWVFEGNGTGIEMNITDFDVNGALGDYLLIKPGGLDDTRNDGIIITHHLSSERRFRFASVNKLFVRFEAKQGMAFKKGFSFNIKMLFPPTEDEVEDDTEVPTLPPPLHTLTVHLGGVSLPQFLQMQEDFRILVADMATLYINANGIEAQNTTSSVTQLIATTLCNVNWPGVENCVEVRFAVPVSHDEEDPRLNEEDLQAMWYTYVYLDPFAARLRQMGISSFSVPNAGVVLSVWLVIGLGVLISMTMLAFVLWRYSCVEDYTRMQNLSDTGSIDAEKRPLDLYPTPHQTLPPLYSDMYKNPYGDATVDMDGFNNQGYAQDNLFDIDSDDEAIKRERPRGHERLRCQASD